VRVGRLSVSPVTPDQWKALCSMGKVDATLAK